MRKGPEKATELNAPRAQQGLQGPRRHMPHGSMSIQASSSEVRVTPGKSHAPTFKVYLEHL